MANKRRCNLCGKELDMWDLQEDFSIRHSEIGYGSRYDMCSLDIWFCCSCMDSIIDDCVIKPVADLEEGGND